jgi:hypothetical protein
MSTTSPLAHPIGTSTNPSDDSALIDEKRLCADLGISSVTATKWRARAEGPLFIKVRRLVRYRRSDVALPSQRRRGVAGIAYRWTAQAVTIMRRIWSGERTRQCHAIDRSCPDRGLR